MFNTAGFIGGHIRPSGTTSGGGTARGPKAIGINIRGVPNALAVNIGARLLILKLFRFKSLGNPFVIVSESSLLSTYYVIYYTCSSTAALS